MHTVFSDGESHRTEGAERSRLHDEGDDLERDVRKRIGEAGERLVLVECNEGESDEDGEEQHLEDFTFGKGTGEGVRNDVEKEVDAGKLLAGAGVLGDGFYVEATGVDVHAAARLEESRHAQPDR